jgi:non-homologous end joining protein Ku
MRKLIDFDDEIYQALLQLERYRMGSLQELADEAFADLMKKHGVPRDLKDALRRSVSNSSAKKPAAKLTATAKRRALKPQKTRAAKHA